MANIKLEYHGKTIKVFDYEWICEIKTLESSFLLLKKDSDHY